MVFEGYLKFLQKELEQVIILQLLDSPSSICVGCLIRSLSGAEKKEDANVSNGMIPLKAVNEYRRLERKPPVTAAILAANTLIYLRPAFLHQILPKIEDVLFNAHLIVKVHFRVSFLS